MSSGCDLGLTALKLCNSETCTRWGMFSGCYLPLCDQNRRKIWGETSKAQKLWGEFCFVSMWSLQLPFETEGNATRKAVVFCKALVWSLPEASTALRPGIQGWRGCGLGPWWPLFFRYLLNFCDDTRYCAKKARMIYVHWSSILRMFSECDFVQVLQLALEIGWW